MADREADGSRLDPITRVSNLSFSEICSVTLQLNERIEVIWQRVIYIHAAMIGVMVFFSEAQTSYTLARALVFAFYTVNLIIAYFNLREIYDGLSTVQRDMQRYSSCEVGGELIGWLRKRNYTYKTSMRAVILIIAWILVGALLFLDTPWN